MDFLLFGESSDMNLKNRILNLMKCVIELSKIDISFLQEKKKFVNLLMRGYSVSQISKELSLKMSTISTYKNRIHKKKIQII